MADINVERKRSGGPNFLPWLLGLLLLGLLIWGLSRVLGGGGDDADPVPATDSTTMTVDTMMPAATPVTPMPADSAAAGMGGQVTGAVDSAGGDNVPEGPTGNP